MIRMNAKFNSKCAETGKQLKKGSPIFYDPSERRAYHPESMRARQYQDEQENDRQNVSGYVQAQEEAYFDNWAASNL